VIESDFKLNLGSY